MKKMIVLLGNPGKEYQKTRHNAAWLCADQFHPDLPWAAFGNSLMAKTPEALWLKPQTFMNLSGKAIAEAWQYFNKDSAISPETLLVVHDDMDFPSGEAAWQADRGPAGNNGIISAIESLGTKNFSRARLGIGRPEYGDPADYVLGKMNDAETEALFGAWEKEIEPKLSAWVKS